MSKSRNGLAMDVNGVVHGPHRLNSPSGLTTGFKEVG